MKRWILTSIYTRTLLVAILAVMLILGPSRRADADLGHVVRGNLSNGAHHKQKEEKDKKKEEEKKKVDDDNEGKQSGDDNGNGTSSSTYGHERAHRDYNYHRDDNYSVLYSYWSPSYERIVDMYFNQASARLNEGFFYDEEAGIEYLPGEWFDLVINADLQAVVEGEDMKVRYTVSTVDGDKLDFGKVFNPIHSGSNETVVVRAFPASLLNDYQQIYVKVILTIEGNDATGGFWLETLPEGNKGPLKVNDVIIADPVPGGESNPRYNLMEGNQYRIFAEYDIDYFLSDYAPVQWVIYGEDGQDIVSGEGYIQARAGYGYFTADFEVPVSGIGGTRPAYFDLKITSTPYLGRKILEITVTGQGSGIQPQTGYPPSTPPSSAQVASPYGVKFTYAQVVTSGGETGDAPLPLDMPMFGMVRYYLDGIDSSAEEKLSWTLTKDGKYYEGGDTKSTVSNGEQDRSIGLHLKNDNPAGVYLLQVDIYINDVLSGEHGIFFQAKQGTGGGGTDEGGSDENYYSFDGFNIFLPYAWDVSRGSDGLSFIPDSTDSALKGTLVTSSYTGGASLAEVVANYEASLADTRLTGDETEKAGHKIISTLAISMDNGVEKEAHLYGYFIVNRTEDGYDFTVIRIDGPPDSLKKLLDTFQEVTDGLSFTD